MRSHIERDAQGVEGKITMNGLIHILISDDHPIVRQGLLAVLVSRNGMKVIGEATNGKEAVELAHKLHPDVILMDLTMPEVSGVEATAQILRENPKARVLILTSFGTDELASQAIRAGAMGFLMKDSLPDDILHAIRSVFKGQFTIPQNVAQALYKSESNPVETKISLTEREEEVLGLIKDGLTNRQVAVQLSIGENTVRTHVGSLLRKLGLTNRTELAIYAIQRIQRR
jgi:two-component system, NarL family, response regulator LiaR